MLQKRLPPFYLTKDAILNIRRICLVALFSGMPLAFVSAQSNTPSDDSFYTPTIGALTETFSPSAGDGDDTAAFNQLLAAVSPIGGVVNVAAGTYRFRGVSLQSNVHLRFAPDAVVLPAGTTGPTIFDGNSRNGHLGGLAPLNNFSLEGAVGPGKRFTIDLSSLPNTERIRAMQFGHTENFRIANFDVLDNSTAFPAMAFTASIRLESTPNGQRISEVRGASSGGIIENLTTSNASYGYGLVQIQAANNLLFRDIASTGGVTLRIETDYEPVQFATPEQFEILKVDQIFGRGITSTNGKAGVLLSPHTLDQGTIDISGVVAIGSELAVQLGPGFVSKKEGSFQVEGGLTPGSFSSDTTIRNITATFGQNAQLSKLQRLRFLPDELREPRVAGVGIQAELSPDGRGRIGPSLGAVLMQRDSTGFYEVNLPQSEVEAIGFNIKEFKLPENAFFMDSADDFEAIDGVRTNHIAGVNFFVENELRNTPNRQLAAILLGDVNLDDVVDFSDVGPFISILLAGGFQDEADLNEDGLVDFFDIPPFITVLSAQ